MLREEHSANTDSSSSGMGRNDHGQPPACHQETANASPAPAQGQAGGPMLQLICSRTKHPPEIPHSETSSTRLRRHGTCITTAAHYAHHLPALKSGLYGCVSPGCRLQRSLPNRHKPQNYGFPKGGSSCKARPSGSQDNSTRPAAAVRGAAVPCPCMLTRSARQPQRHPVLPGICTSTVKWRRPALHRDGPC